MASFTPGAQSVRTKYNFVSAFDVHKPDVDDKLTLKYGRESLQGLLTMVGNKAVTIGKEYIHHEADRLMPIIKATCGAGGAGASVTFTLDASAMDTVDYNNTPHISTDTEQIIPVNVGDAIMIKPASGIVSASTYVRALVTAVDSGAGTFDATPLDSADSIPAISTADEIVIYSTVFGEESSSPESRNSKTIKYTNNVQIFREAHKITGTEDSIVLWFSVQNPKTGKAESRWSIKGEADTYQRFLNYKELGLLLGEKITNTTLANAYAPANPITSTEGLVPFILGNGVVSNYSSVTGWTLNDAEAMVLELDKQKGSKHNLLKCGINLSAQIDRELGDRFQNGAVTYGNFDFNSEKMVSLEYKTFSVAGYTFHKDTYSPFNDHQTLGADGYGFPDEGMVIPMDNQIDAKSRESIPSLRLRYLQNREHKMSYRDRFDIDGVDRIEIDYLSECGFEGFAGNRFGYIKKA